MAPDDINQPKDEHVVNSSNELNLVPEGEEQLQTGKEWGEGEPQAVATEPELRTGIEWGEGDPQIFSPIQNDSVLQTGKEWGEGEPQAVGQVIDNVSTDRPIYNPVNPQLTSPNDIGGTPKDGWNGPGATAMTGQPYDGLTTMPGQPQINSFTLNADNVVAKAAEIAQSNLGDTQPGGGWVTGVGSSGADSMVVSTATSSAPSVDPTTPQVPLSL